MPATCDEVEQHPHFCECSECMNVGGGLKLEGAGVVYAVDPQTFSRRRAQRREAVREVLADRQWSGW